MWKTRDSLLLSLSAHHLVLLLLLIAAPPATADVGTAAHYGPPYLPTVCYGSDIEQLPVDGMFAAAGNGVWNNGAACGRNYMVRCLSSAAPGACVDGGGGVQVVVVDHADALNSDPSVNGTTIVLSKTAFKMIANISSAMEINVEFIQV